MRLHSRYIVASNAEGTVEWLSEAKAPYRTPKGCGGCDVMGR